MAKMPDQHKLQQAGLALVQWYQAGAQPLPWRLLWQKTKDPYVVWVSEIMLQQTTIPVVWPKYENFMKCFPTVTKLAETSLDEVLLECRGLGYYRRFRTLHQAAREIVAKTLPYQQKRPATKAVVWPDTYEEWLEVPGVGNYTAAAVSSITREAPVAVIDGNVERVMQRYLAEDFAGNTAQLKRWVKPFLEAMLTAPYGAFNQALMELGQRVCTKSSPQCSLCPIATHCLAKKGNKQNSIPSSKAKPAAVPVALDMFIAVQREKIGLYARDESYRFLPRTIGFRYETSRERQTARRIGSFSHSITHHKIKVSVFVHEDGETNQQWVATGDAERLLVSNLDRKALQVFLKQQREPADIFS